MTDLIKQTAHYKSITDKTVQAFLLLHDNRKRISHGIEVTKNISFERWCEISKPSPHVREIVRELVINNIEVR